MILYQGWIFTDGHCVDGYETVSISIDRLWMDTQRRTLIDLAKPWINKQLSMFSVKCGWIFRDGYAIRLKMDVQIWVC
jgi:hypothetical protein